MRQLEIIKETLRESTEPSEQGVVAMKGLLSLTGSMAPILNKQKERIDDFYCGNLLFVKLFPKKVESNDSRALFMYDEEQWCEHHQCNCRRVRHKLGFGLMYDDSAFRIANEIKKADHWMSPANILFGNMFKTHLTASRGLDSTMRVYEEVAELEVLDEDRYRTRKIVYKGSQEIIEAFRKVSYMKI